MCRVSIILPTYNRRHRIEKAIESVLCQSVQDYELIIVDDASTDETEAYIQPLLNKAVRYIRLPRNVGAAAARNAGIQEAMGEYIAFQDSAAEWMESKLEKQLAYMDSQDSSVAMVYSPYRTVYSKHTLIYPSLDVPVEEKSGNILRFLLEHPLVDTPTMMVRRDVLSELGGFDSSMRALEDYDLSIRIAKRYEIGIIDEVLVVSYNEKDSISNDTERYIRMSLYLLQKHRRLFDSYNMTIPYLNQLSQYALRYRQLDLYMECLQEVFWNVERG